MGSRQTTTGGFERRRKRHRLVSEADLGRMYLRLRRDAVFAGAATRGAGQHVMLLPGFLSGDELLGALAGWLRRSGYVPRRSGIHLNVRCAEATLAELERRLELVAYQAGGPVALVGHSRGGQFARVLAVRRPELVSGIVTLGAPPLDPRAVQPLVALTAIGVTALGTLGVPRLMHASCFLGSCCRQFRVDVHAPFPRGVGFVSVCSPNDPVVDWRRVMERHGRRVEVGANHVGLVFDPEAYAAVGDALASFWPAPARTPRAA